MLSKVLNEALNKQIINEAVSSQVYLAMASWSDIQPGLEGVTEFFYEQSNEERVHMLKLVRYINERGGFAEVPALAQPPIKYKSLRELFKKFFDNELEVSESINDLVEMALKEKDYATHNFLQWYVSEQMEEERLARRLNEKLELLGEDKSGLYLFDRDINAIRARENGGGGKPR